MAPKAMEKGMKAMKARRAEGGTKKWLFYLKKKWFDVMVTGEKAGLHTVA